MAFWGGRCGTSGWRLRSISHEDRLVQVDITGAGHPYQVEEAFERSASWRGLERGAWCFLDSGGKSTVLRDEV